MRQHAPTHRRLRALLVSADMPDPLGTPAQRAAWSLLEAAASGYRVELVVLGRGPVHLEAWEAALELSEQVTIGSGRSALGAPAEGLAPVRFDALLCRGTRAWLAARAWDATRRVLDWRDGGDGGRPGGAVGWTPRGAWTRWRRAQGIQRARAAARACGEVLVSSPEQAGALSGSGTRVRVIVPGDRQALRRALHGDPATRPTASAVVGVTAAVAVRTAA